MAAKLKEWRKCRVLENSYVMFLCMDIV